jgi:hypothetical protein
MNLIQDTAANRANDVMAVVPFLDPAGGAPENHFRAPERNKGRYVSLTVPVCNGRKLAQVPSIDREGFGFARHASQVMDFYDPAEVRKTYYPEIEAFVKAQTGATFVYVYGDLVRGNKIEQKGQIQVRAAAQFVHNDFTPEAARNHVRELVPAADAERLFKSRFMQINVWRPIRGPLQTKPLVVCDARTTQPEDFYIGTNYGSTDTSKAESEYYVLTYRPGQRWCYFPDMQPDEVILIKNYDSTMEDRLSAHGSMDDPHMPPNAMPRESIEARTLVFFSDEAPALLGGLA